MAVPSTRQGHGCWKERAIVRFARARREEACNSQGGRPSQALVEFGWCLVEGQVSTRSKRCAQLAAWPGYHGEDIWVAAIINQSLEIMEIQISCVIGEDRVLPRPRAFRFARAAVEAAQLCMVLKHARGCFAHTC